MVDDTAAVVPGLHGFANVLREVDTRSHAVLSDLGPRWNAAADAAASADAEQADAAQGVGRGAVAPAVPRENGARRAHPDPAAAAPPPQLIDPAVVAPAPQPPRPLLATPAPAGRARPRKRPRSDGHDDTSRRRPRTRSGNNSSGDEDPGAATDANSTAGNDDRPRAAGRAPIPIDAAVLVRLARDDFGKLISSPNSVYTISQDRNDTVPLREIRAALGRKIDGRIPWDNEFLESIGVTKERMRFCTACGHAPYTVRTRCCDGWTEKGGVISGVVVFGVRRRRHGPAPPVQDKVENGAVESAD
ncbi:hypothetical protein AMAG_17403 [Allomyces macrogynus ATCC 38327]|uniref:Uncharacterized protein n=1 Tax=Allomyces macrogynus (strain ATCC 38327) TaxID=578462 RepID=A0A0L0TF41_ALLM3|nr:hypothetical protein AMAG_17403 [Allomyces macrogynus ATCC 38327]|eukprot:KNE73214.1 hypothetical protein AMAG_17403 [Allomyces macrogynus ATCC 38327]